MKKIRILLVGMPPMLIEIISEIAASETDLLVVGSVSEDSDIGSVIRRTGADVVIMQQSQAAGMTEEGVLISGWHPRKLITLKNDGRNGSLHELRPHHTPLGELSASNLLAAIRGGASWPVKEANKAKAQ